VRRHLCVLLCLLIFLSAPPIASFLISLFISIPVSEFVLYGYFGISAFFILLNMFDRELVPH